MITIEARLDSLPNMRAHTFRRRAKLTQSKTKEDGLETKKIAVNQSTGRSELELCEEVAAAEFALYHLERVSGFTPNR